ncbi:MAG: hypothetical protein IPI11_01665 [Haliscomenobacter sp.]|nr:hypothetical protein [Haliscomenobacter sp.]
MQRITLRNGLLGLLLLGGIALYVAQFVWACSPDKGLADAASPGEEYLGEASCRSCHEQEFKDWLGSHHDHAMEEATDSTVLGDFSGVSFSSKGIVSQFFRREGSLWSAQRALMASWRILKYLTPLDFSRYSSI